ncbi:MAG: anti-sigma factor [Nocardioides sp.]
MIDIHALSGAYAVDALDDVEREQFEAHLAECCECQAEVDSLREAAGLLPETTYAEPTASLREGVLAGITGIRPLPPLIPPATPVEDSASAAEATGAVVVPFRRRARRQVAGLVAAAAAVAAVGVGATVWHPWESTSQSPATSVADQVLHARDAETYVQKLPGGGEARLVRSPGLGKAVITATNMPPLPSDRVYELWYQDPDAGMVPAGLMTGDTLVLTGDATRAIGAGITVEPSTGSHVPTTAPVTLFTFKKDA